ncbi:hypothetical protein [Priestia megaterium]|uniref:hypothetical protein n=1 Tax=Priestia megaterium TaxID=1404 RepID=UPI003CC5CC20
MPYKYLVVIVHNYYEIDTHEFDSYEEAEQYHNDWGSMAESSYLTKIINEL